MPLDEACCGWPEAAGPTAYLQPPRPPLLHPPTNATLVAQSFELFSEEAIHGRRESQGLPASPEHRPLSMPFTIGLTPCAACKLLRRKCSNDCLFAPHFPAEQAQNFAIVHRVFGAANVSKMLQDVQPEQRADAVSSLVYEAQARLRDPVYGTVGAISSLQQRVEQLERQLALAQAEAILARVQQQPLAQMSCNSCNSCNVVDKETWADILLRDAQVGSGGGGGGGGAVVGVRAAAAGGAGATGHHHNDFATAAAACKEAGSVLPQLGVGVVGGGVGSGFFLPSPKNLQFGGQPARDEAAQLEDCFSSHMFNRARPSPSYPKHSCSVSRFAPICDIYS